MKLNTPIHNGSPDWLLEMNEMEHEEVTPPPVDFVAEVERLCTLELISIMRNVRESSRSMDEVTRERFAKRFEALSLEATAAAAYLRRFRASDEIPEWLRETGQL